MPNPTLTQLQVGEAGSSENGNGDWSVRLKPLRPGSRDEEGSKKEAPLERHQQL
ncbi:MAG TPA: hypothetical protein VGP12_07960 [Nitrosospira sp.]|nr:hypothetical protein [Nitrosospira sp.]